MFVEITPVSLMWALYALAALVLAALVFKQGLVSTNIAISLYLVQQFFGTLAALVAFTATDDGVALAAFGGGVYVWLLWAPVVFVAAPLVLWGSRRFHLALALGVLGALPTLALVAQGAANPSAIFADDAHTTLTTLASSLILWSFTGFACTVTLVALEAFTTPLPMQRAKYALLAAAFAGEGMFHAAQNAAKVLFRADFFGEAAATGAQRVLVFLPAAILACLGVYVAWVAARDEDADRRRWARIFLAILAVAAITGAVSAQLVTGEEYHHPEGVFHALWDLATICLLVFAALRFQLFRIELQAKKGLATSLGALLSAGVFVSAEELMQNFIQEQFFSSLPGATSIVVSALVAAAAAIPIFGLAEALIQRVFPQIRDTPEYGSERREALYRVAVESAYQDGNITARELSTLQKLRAHLGVTDEEHARIEGSVRALVTTGAPAAG
jgi:hypothetical protein